ncbi:MAG: hypothetical protein ACJ8F7_20410 [Gemmataceae bacterium]
MSVGTPSRPIEINTAADTAIRVGEETPVANRDERKIEETPAQQLRLRTTIITQLDGGL